MDATTVSLVVGIVGAILGTTGGIVQLCMFLIRRNDTNKQKTIRLLQEKPDLAVTRLSEALNQLANQNQRLEEDQASLQAKYQGAIDLMDNLIKENRQLKQQLEEARTECNKKK